MLRQILVISIIILSCMFHSGAQARQLYKFFSPADSFNKAYDTLPTSLAVRSLAQVYRSLCPVGVCGTITLVQNTTPGYVNAAFTYPSTIRYSPDMMNFIAQRYGLDAAYGVLAHEFGHYMDTQKPTRAYMNLPKTWGLELRADAWAGCALAMNHHQPKPFLRFLSETASEATPKGYPDIKLRASAVLTGFKNCQSQM